MTARRFTARSLSAVLLTVGLGAGLLASCSSSSSQGSSTAPPPGTVLSSTPITNAPAGAKGWRIVYETTTATGAPATSSGTIYVPSATPPSTKRLVVAWAHPTVGMATDCTPSRAVDPAAAIPGLAEMLAKGWVVTSTDYTGLGTPGVLPYLVGQGEARNVIDSVRAAEDLKGTDAGSTYAIWGHSQGGHAALFTPSMSTSYAPNLKLVGVAGAAPAAEFSSLFSLQWQQSISWVIGSEVVQSWPHYYPALKPAKVLTPLALASAKKLASVCITSDAAALAASFGPYFTKPFFSVNPTSIPAWRSVFVKNTPTAPKVPVFVAQGLADTVVLPSTTAQLEQSWCSKGVSIDVQWYPTATHFTVPTIAAPDAVAWLAARFAGTKAPSTCATTPPVAPATNPSIPS